MLSDYLFYRAISPASGGGGSAIKVLNSVLDFGSEQITNGMEIPLSNELVAELNTAPDVFMVRCKQFVDGITIYATALFLPMEMEGMASGYNSVFVFVSGYTVYSATIVNMGGEWRCQVGVSE